jgi:hypothetical protein
VNPPLKLVLFENPSVAGTINHLGVEVFSTQEVEVAARQFAERGLATDVEEQTTCCFAVQDKVWVDGPDQSRWEVYTVLADATQPIDVRGDGACCTTTSFSEETTTACC